MASAGAFNKNSGVVTQMQQVLTTAHDRISKQWQDNAPHTEKTPEFGQNLISGFGADVISSKYSDTMNDYFTGGSTGMPHLRQQLGTLFGVAGQTAQMYTTAGVTEQAAATYIHQRLDGAF